MSAPDTSTTVSTTGTTNLRAVFEDLDVLGMVYAETYRARRDNLPHNADAACLLTQPAPGCDGLCSVAIAEVIDDAVGFYERQKARGVIADLANPGGYARTIIRQRHLDVVRALTTPEGGYRRPERIADPAKQPAYLGLTDEVDGLLVSACMFYLRSGNTATNWDRVCERAEATCLRKGHPLEPGEARARLERFIEAALNAGGRAEEFVRRELLDLLAARSVTISAEVGDVRATRDNRLLAQSEAAYDHHAVSSLLRSLEAALARRGGWHAASRRDRREAVRLVIGSKRPDGEIDEIVALVHKLHSGAAATTSHA